MGMRLHKTPYVNLSAFLYLYTIIQAHRHAIWTHFIKRKFDLGCQTYKCMNDVVSFIMGESIIANLVLLAFYEFLSRFVILLVM